MTNISTKEKTFKKKKVVEIKKDSVVFPKGTTLNQAKSIRKIESNNRTKELKLNRPLHNKLKYEDRKNIVEYHKKLDEQNIKNCRKIDQMNNIQAVSDFVFND